MAKLLEKILKELKDNQKDIEIITSNSYEYYGKITSYDSDTIILENSSEISVINRDIVSHINYEP